MSARNSLFSTVLLYYICGGLEYISAQPTGVRIFHTLSHGFKIPQSQQRPDAISFGGMNGGYMAIQLERHPWERHRFQDRYGYDPNKDFVIAQPNFHNSEKIMINRLSNIPPFVLNSATVPLEAPSVNVALSEDAIIVNHPWHNPHGRRHHHRCHHDHRSMISDPGLKEEDLQGAGYEAGSFGQTTIFGNANNGIREWENIGPQRRGGGKPKEDAVTDITPTVSTTTPAAISTTTDSAKEPVEITEPASKPYKTTTINTLAAISTTKTYETTSVSNLAKISTTGATVTVAPTESTFEIDVRSGLA